MLNFHTKQFLYIFKWTIFSLIIILIASLSNEILAQAGESNTLNDNLG